MDNFYVSTDDRYRDFVNSRERKEIGTELETVRLLIEFQSKCKSLHNEIKEKVKNNCTDDEIKEWCLKHNYNNCKESDILENVNFVYYFKHNISFGNDFFRAMQNEGLVFNSFFPMKFLEEKLLFLEQIEFNKIQREKYFKNQEDLNKYDTYIFNTKESFELFMLFTERYVVDSYKDFSFIYHKMLSDNFIFRMKHNDFIDWLLENNFINSTDRQSLQWNEGLSKKFSSYTRLAYYQKIKDELGI